MRLVRFGSSGSEKPGILDTDGTRRDLSAEFEDWNCTFFSNGGLDRLFKRLSTTTAPLPAVPEAERWAAPIARPGKIICIGLNYFDHAEESKMPIPAEPIVFLKAPNTIIGPYDSIQIPRGSEKTDWEIELGIVIGTEARYLTSVENSTRSVAGYCISHDVSERSFQLERGGQWTKGKSCDTFNPMGPWVATPDEIPNLDQLSMKLWVNGELRQSGTTEKMIFKVGFLVHYLSQFMTLEPGDLISTGTPPGVGLGMKPPKYLKAGDVVNLEIDQLGKQMQRCIPSRRSET